MRQGISRSGGRRPPLPDGPGTGRARMGGATRNGPRHPEVQRPRASGWDPVQLIHIENSGRSESIGSLSVNVGGELDVIVEPERFQGNGISFEVLQHGGDTVKPQVLDVAATAVHSHSKMLQEKDIALNRCFANDN